MNIIYIILRRMRRPLLTLILVYALAILGLVLIPGQDGDGNPWHMDFFHAFYFVSFMSTTIGFGEIPYPFTGGQRMWVAFALYGSVISWIYAIGTLLALVQDRTFQQAVRENLFARRIRHLPEPFYLICGYGETGSALVRSLTDRDQHVVVVDIDQDRVNLLQLENLRQYVPALHGDASLPVHLLEAGLEHPLCEGVVALTNSNEVNLKVAITSKLLHPDIKVICRAESRDIENNMASFGTDYVIDPFDTFANHLAIALQAPGLYLLHEWLSGMSYEPLHEPVYPPQEGHWIICGYGRFGKAVYRRLKGEGIDPVVVEFEPELTAAPEGTIRGRGTEASTLEEAGIDQAVGLVAGTDDDANNLSIIMTARVLRSDLFVVARQNRMDNHAIIQAVNADMVMHSSTIIANKVRVLLGTPLLHEFMSLSMYESEGWSCELISRITALVESKVPTVWEVDITPEQALAVCSSVERGVPVALQSLISDPGDNQKKLACIPLLVKRDSSTTMLPEEGFLLKPGDRLLFCGRESARDRLGWALQNTHALDYILTGEVRPQGWAWRLFRKVH
ncbi:MAG: NAD-binding protein [Sedimenticola sp.]